MIEEKIIERVSKKANKDFAVWYQIKVLELTNSLLKKAQEEIPVKNNRPSEQRELEVMAK